MAVYPKQMENNTNNPDESQNQNEQVSYERHFLSSARETADNIMQLSEHIHKMLSKGTQIQLKNVRNVIKKHSTAFPGKMYR
jgi:aminoglycoside N3'-acetyltransferase